MSPETALNEKLARRLLGVALDRLDRMAPEDRTNALRIPIDEKTAPEIFRPETTADREIAWHVLEVLSADGIGTIEYRKAARNGSREDRRPVFDVSTSPDNEERLRAFYGRPRPGLRYSEEWRAAVDASDLDDAAKAAVADLPLTIKGRSAAQVLGGLMSIRHRHDPSKSIYLREVSSRAFWGLSKVLDNRTDLVAAVLRLPECPYPSQPVHLNVYFAGGCSWLLFIENKASFGRAIRDAREALVRGRPSAYADAALIYSSGFMGAASRLRKPTGSRIFYSLDEISKTSEMATFNAAFYGDADIDAAFWGDLDPAGMAILSSLRGSFPSARAWEPGYAPMLARLEAGEGHDPEEAGKSGQRPVASTGCRYADRVLIPSLAKCGRFIDQE
jgi:hypothetical protein